MAGFDTRLSNTADPDLEGPPWAGGNLAASNTVLGLALILAQGNQGANTGFLTNPDDEGSRPAGTITFSFDRAISTFGFDNIDIEGVVVEGSSLDFFLGGNLVGSVNFAMLTDIASMFYDASIQFGNNTANRVSPITAADLGSSFDTVRLNLGGSGAIDNILVPAPGSALLMTAGLLGLARRRR